MFNFENTYTNARINSCNAWKAIFCFWALPPLTIVLSMSYMKVIGGINLRYTHRAPARRNSPSFK